MMPVRSLEISFSSSPASRIACSMATWFQAVPPPRKRIARRSTDCLRVERRRAMHLAAKAELRVFVRAHDAGFGLAQACQHFLGVVADRRDDTHPGDDDTSHYSLVPHPQAPDCDRWPIWPYVPVPVITGCVACSEQTDLQVERTIDDRAICRQPAVGDAEHQLRAHHALDFETVDDVLHRRQHLTGELELTEAERATLARRPSQPRKKPSSCHNASRPRHPGMTGSPLKWQGKNQRSGFRSRTARTRPLPYSPPASAISEMRSNISIGGSGNCGPSSNSLTAPAGQQVLVRETGCPVLHSRRSRAAALPHSRTCRPNS